MFISRVEGRKRLADSDIRLARMTLMGIEAAVADGYGTVFEGKGSIKQHCPDLRLWTDALLGYALGEQVVRRLPKDLLAPAVLSESPNIPWLSKGHRPYRPRRQNCSRGPYKEPEYYGMVARFKSVTKAILGRAIVVESQQSA